MASGNHAIGDVILAFRLTVCENPTIMQGMIRQLLIKSLMALVLLGGAVYAGESESAAGVDLMRMSQDARCGQVVVTCLLNGVPMRMMLDTGATHTVLHEASAAAVKGAQWIDTSRMQFSGNATQRPKLMMAELRVGPAVSAKHVIMALDLSGVRSMMAEPIDGIVGMDVLGQLAFTFDLPKQAMYWGVPEGRELVPLHAVPDGMGRVMVQGRCEGQTVTMLLDTGSSVTRAVADQWKPGKAMAGEMNVSDVNSARKVMMQTGKPGNLELGPGVELKQFSPVLCEAHDRPMLGMDALRTLTLVHVPRPDAPHGLFLLAK